MSAKSLIEGRVAVVTVGLAYTGCSYALAAQDMGTAENSSVGAVNDRLEQSYAAALAAWDAARKAGNCNGKVMLADSRGSDYSTLVAAPDDYLEIAHTIIAANGFVEEAFFKEGVADWNGDRPLPLTGDSVTDTDYDYAEAVEPTRDVMVNVIVTLPTSVGEVADYFSVDPDRLKTVVEHYDATI